MLQITMLALVSENALSVKLTAYAILTAKHGGSKKGWCKPLCSCQKGADIQMRECISMKHRSQKYPMIGKDKQGLVCLNTRYPEEAQ